MRRILGAAVSCYRDSPGGGLGAVSPISEQDAMWVQRIVYRDHGAQALAFQAMWFTTLHDLAERADQRRGAA